MNSEQPVLLIVVLRWIARVGSLISGGLLLAFLFGPNELQQPTTRELLGLVFFPTGILCGMALAWKYELAGGLLVVGSLIAFYAWHFITADGLPSGPYFVLFASPGLLFLVVGLLSKRESSVPKSNASEPFQV